MRKAITFLTCAMMTVSSMAEMTVIDSGQFAFSVSGAAGNQFIPAGHGIIVAGELDIQVASAVTILVERPFAKAVVAARDGVLVLDVKTGTSNIVDGVSLSVGDSFIYSDSAISTSKSVINSIGAFSDGVTSYGIDATAVDLAAGDVVYPALASDRIAISTVTADQKGMIGTFTGFARLPVAIQLPSATGSVSGTYTIQH